MRRALITLTLALGLGSMFPSFATLPPEEILKDYVMEKGYSEVSQNIAHALIESGAGVLVDVRTQGEFDAGHIEGALNIPVDEIKPGVDPALLPDKHKPVLLYCRTGRRATTAGQRLVANGYEYVVNFGGVSTWHYGLIATP